MSFELGETVGFAALFQSRLSLWFSSSLGTCSSKLERRTGELHTTAKKRIASKQIHGRENRQLTEACQRQKVALNTHFGRVIRIYHLFTE